MTLEAVIFDLDGTLLDTLDDLREALNYALAAVGRPAVERARVRDFVGNGVKKLVTRALDYTGDPADTPALFERCHATFTEYYVAHMTHTAPYAGVREVLRELKESGIKTAVVTNKFDEAAKLLVGELLPEIDVTVGTSAFVRPKPSPDGTNAALNALGVERARAVYVGDGETDIATARACGLPAVAVCWGFRDRAVIEKLEPDFIIEKPAELVPLLQSAGLLPQKRSRS